MKKKLRYKDLIEKREKIKEENARKKKEFESKLKEEERAIQEKLTKVRNSEIFRLGSIFEKLNLLEVDYIVLLGCIAEQKERLLKPGSEEYTRWERRGFEISPPKIKESGENNDGA